MNIRGNAQAIPRRRFSMALSPHSMAVCGGLLLGALHTPALAAPAKPASKPAAHVAAKPAPKPAPVESAADKASAARGRAILKAVEDQMTAAKAIAFTGVINETEGASKKTLAVDAALQRPGDFALTLSQDGKDIGKVALTADGGTAYDPANNKFVKLDKGTAPDTAMMAAARMLPRSGMGGIFIVESLLLQKHSFLIELPPNGQMTVKVRASDETLAGKGVVHVTQTLARKEMAITYHLFVDKDSITPARYGFTMAEGGKERGSMYADFSKFQMTGDTMAETTFQFTPPDTAVAFTPPAQPEEAPILANGSVAPNFAVQDVKGKTVHLADFAGKVVVIDFWSTWCGPCQQSLPGTDKIAKKYASKGVVFMPVCSWDEKSAFTPWVNKHKTWTMTFYFDPAGHADNNIAATLYKVSGIPTQFVIGKDGKVAAGSVGYEGEESEKALTTAIDKALAASS